MVIVLATTDLIYFNFPYWRVNFSDHPLKEKKYIDEG